MRVKLAAVATAAAFVTAFIPGVVQADHSWNNYHWARASNPFTLKLGDNVDSEWDRHLRTTSTDWTKSSVVDTPVTAGGTKPRSCRGTRGRVEVCNAPYGNTGWLGIASISITSGSHITQGIVKLNDTYFNTAKYNTPAWRNVVSCQEVGHTLGLDHQDERFDNADLGTCMDYSNNPVPNQHPNAHDYTMLEQIYAHLDSVTTVGGTGGKGNGRQSGNDASSWGRLVSGSRAAGHSTYVRNLGDGQQVVTFVTWA